MSVELVAERLSIVAKRLQSLTHVGGTELYLSSDFGAAPASAGACSDMSLL